MAGVEERGQRRGRWQNSGSSVCCKLGRRFSPFGAEECDTLRGLTEDVLTEDLNGALCEQTFSSENLEQSGFAGAIRTNEDATIALVEVQGQIGKCDCAAMTEGKTTNVDSEGHVEN